MALWYKQTNVHTQRVPLCFVFAVNKGKGVDDAEEVTCFAGSNKGSNSEVQSLSSFQSDSGDDNGKKQFNLYYAGEKSIYISF